MVKKNKQNFQILGYNVLDIILLFSGLITITTVSIVFNSPWYILTSTLFGLLCVFTQAKGKVINQFLCVVYFIFYIIISYTQAVYGEAILYLIIMLPLYIYGCIHWLKNRDKKDNVVLVRGNLSKKEWLIFSLCLCGVAVGVFFVLKALNTAEVWVSTLAFVSMLPAVYLLVRRCKWNQVAFLINDFIVPIIWLLLIINGSTILIPMFVGYFFQITYDVYGLINWIKLEKKQKADKKRI